MKRMTVLLAVGLLVLFVGCGPKLTVVLLEEVPEIDHAGIDHLLDYEGAEISKDRLFIIVRGTAKMYLGLSTGVNVERHTKAGLLDTIGASITSGKEVPQPEKQPVDLDADPSVMPPRPPMPPPSVIEEGGPVHIMINATMSGGRITRLIITATPGGPEDMLPPLQTPGDIVPGGTPE